MHPQALTILRLLATGQFHSGEAIAQQLGLSRTTIWQRVNELQELGLPIDCVRGRGYHLARQIELLDIEWVQQQLASNAWHIHYEPIVDSTMDFWHKQQHAHREVSTCELQVQGRGRQGRKWVNPFADCLMFSIAWQFQNSMPQLSGLSLAVGVMVRRACQQAEIELKWPNDLVVAGKKLGGVLIELRGEMQGPCTAIIGMGLNINLPKEIQQTVGRPICDLASLNNPLSRNALLVRVLQELESGLQLFSEQGFAAFQTEWQQADALNNRVITFLSNQGEQSGCVRGVDSSGQLIVEQDGILRLFASGEIVHVQNIHEFSQ